jgi:predicted MFS family arabinose efflux permease
VKGLSSQSLDLRGLTAAVVFGTLGALTIMIVPGFVMLISAQTGLDDRHLGFVASADINATAVAMGLATFLIARRNWRHLLIVGAALMVLGTAWTAGSHTYAGVVAARVCAGLGEGLVIAVSFAALGSASNPDRAFGIYLVVGLTVSAAVLALLPWLQVRVGPAAVFAGIAVVMLLSCAFVTWLPERNPASASWSDGAPAISKELAVAGLSGVFLYFIAQGAMWSYFERIGTASGVDPLFIGEAMGLSSFAGMGGALLAVAVCTRTRLGRALPLIVTGGISTLSFFMLRGHVTPAALMTAGLLFNFAWNLAQPLLSGVCAEADSQGRVVVAMGCIQTVGFGLGPALAALLLRGHDFSPIVWMSTSVLVLSLAIVLAGLKARHRRVVSASLRPA